jgi:hypothetical protein
MGATRDKLGFFVLTEPSPYGAWLKLQLDGYQSPITGEPFAPNVCSTIY